MRPVSLTQRAYSLLKQRIIRCELAPGSGCTESELATQLGLGKTPIREALTRLAQEGWVRSIRGHGYEVRPLSLGEVRDLYGARLLIEPAAVELAAGNLDRETLERLMELCDADYDVDDPDDEDAFLQRNREFHTTVVAACGNSIVTDMIVPLLERSERLMHLGMLVRNGTAEVAHDHRELVAALDRGDGPSARTIAREHIVAGQQAAIEALLEVPSLLAAEVAVSPRTGSA